MADPDLTRLIEELRRSHNHGPINATITKIFGLVPAIGAVTGAFTEVVGAIESTEDAYKKMSAAGTSFSNDLINMNVAAVQSRMDLNEFADLISQNGRNLAGLGANVTRGSENFSKLSNEFHKSDDDLRKLGYTTTEMNQLLIDQIAINKTVNINDKIRRDQLTSSTIQFAKELDLTAKLTGKNRAELAEQMRERTAGARLDAAIRLATRNMSEEQATAVRDNINSLRAQAAATGMDKAFQEILETGTVYSETARQQAALGGEAFSEMMKAAQLAKQGHIEESKERMNATKALAAQNLDKVAYQQITTMSGAIGGSLGDTIANMSADLLPLNKSLNNLAESTGAVLQSNKDYVEAMKQIIADAQAAQDSMRPTDTTLKSYEKMGQVAELMTTAAKTIQDIKAGAVTGSSEHLSEYVRDGFAALYNKIPDDMETKTQESIDKFSTILSGGTDSILAATKEMAVDVSQSISDVYSNTIVPAIKTGIKDAVAGLYLAATGNKLPGYSDGTLGVHGNIFGNFDQNGTPVMVHGVEAILTPDQMTTIATGYFNTGIAQAGTLLSNSIGFIQDTIGELSDNIINPDENINDTITSAFDMLQSVSGKIISTQKENDEIFPKLIKIGESWKNATPEQLKQWMEDDKNQAQVKEVIPSDIKNNITTIQHEVNKINPIDVKPSGISPVQKDKPSLSNTFVQKMAPHLMNKTDKPSNEPSTQPPNNNSKVSDKQQENIQSTNEKIHQESTKQSDVMAQILDQLKKLNVQFTQFIDQHEKIGNKQVKATKNISPNLYPQ